MAGLTLPYLDWKYFRFENLDVPVSHDWPCMETALDLCQESKTLKEHYLLPKNCTGPLSKPLKIV